jgi:glycosyltransferase involved in cell wall biosynthesis
MRILIVHNAYLQRGGEDIVAEAEADLLERAGHTVHRAVVSNPVDTRKAVARLGASAWSLSAARFIQAEVQAFKPDVAHIHNTWYSLTPSAPAALRRLGVPTVMTLHNYRYACINGQFLREGMPCEACVDDSAVLGIRYRCYRGSLPASIAASVAGRSARRTWPRDVDRFIAMTDFAKKRFVAAGLSEERIEVKPHHVKDPGPRPGSARSSRVVLFVGRLATEKGIDLLIDAWRKANLDEFRLRVIGDGPLRPDLERISPPSVEFLGWQSPTAVQSEMLNARLLAFPSIWYETFGLAMVESMAAGLPVVASRIGGTPELLGDAGALLPPGDSHAWAIRLGQLVVDEMWIEATSLRGRSRYSQLFTPEQSLRRLEEIYLSLLSA